MQASLFLNPLYSPQIINYIQNFVLSHFAISLLLFSGKELTFVNWFYPKNSIFFELVVKIKLNNILIWLFEPIIYHELIKHTAVICDIILQVSGL